ncbi:hypothetical protein [Methylocella silvestris]|uniref:Uncharacterized protein n=1 Tax=Methylocella silvestris TaxID=199596 RepID=A0A2J7TJS6_METSI|nr:hypothetical protein [Methylocella silvestris]PNG27021.1 hypothetical protein CR492_04775 [Methylocella silvestris]
MTRETLPNRRTSISFDLFYGQMLYSVTFAVYPKTMRVAEIFLTLDRKVGAAVEGIARDSLILASFALQHGASLEELRAAMTRDHAGAASSVAGAAIDAVADTLAEMIGDAPA